MLAQQKTTRYLQRIMIFTFLIIPVVYFREIIFSSIMLYRGDGVGNLASKELIKDALLNGQFPLWNKFNASGTPFAADVQNAVFYPLNFLMLLLPVQLGYELFFALHLSIAAIGMFYYLKQITNQPYLSYAGGLVLMFANILTIRYEHINILASLAWVPILLYVAEQIMETGQRKYHVVLGGIMAVQFLAGFPQITLYSDLIVIAYVLIGSIWKKHRFFKTILNLSLAGLCYIGLVAVQLFALVQLILFSGRDKISYEYFTSFSYSWKMLIQMIYPSFWGPWSANLGITPGFSTDIYLGIIPLVLILYGLRWHFRDFRIKLLLMLMAATYLYACAGEFDLVGKILFRIPLLNSFRVPSRIVPFTVIMGLMLAFYSLGLLITQNDYKKYLKISLWTLAIALAIPLMIDFMGSPVFHLFDEQYRAYYLNGRLYLPAILMLGLNVILAGLLVLYANKPYRRYLVNGACILIALVTVIDVNYINKDTGANVYRIGRIVENRTEEEFDTPVGNYLESLPDKDQFRILVDYDSADEFYAAAEDVKGNNNIFHDLESVQSYTTFQNPDYNNFCFSADGLFISSRALLAQINPAVMSSLSIKYILRKKEDPFRIYDGTESKSVIDQEAAVDRLDGNVNAMSVYQAPIRIEANSMYLISIDFSVSELPSVLFADFYGGSTYDNPEQETSLLPYLKPGSNHREFIFNSGSGSIPEDTVMRLVLQGNTQLEIGTIKINKMFVSHAKQYEPIYHDGQYTVFKNPDAKSLLYSPWKVTRVDDANDAVINSRYTSDIANAVFTESSRDYDLTQAQTTLSHIENQYNYLRADVMASQDTFVVMTQTWYPGWKAFVDGREVPLHEVNGIVLGLEVPEGEHKIEFRFTAPLMVAGGAVTILTLMAMAAYLFYSRRAKGKGKTATNAGRAA